MIRWLPLLLVAGCATNYATTPSAKLCMDYMTLPSFNIHQSARGEELGRRGENCQAYIGAASARQQADRNATDTLIQLQQAQQPPRPMTCTTYNNITTCR